VTLAIFRILKIGEVSKNKIIIFFLCSTLLSSLLDRLISLPSLIVKMADSNKFILLSGLAVYSFLVGCLISFLFFKYYFSFSGERSIKFAFRYGFIWLFLSLAVNVLFIFM
jgi:hypothetical protein